MNQYERDLWPVVARVVLGFFTTALGALLFLHLAVLLKFEFAFAWTYFVMFFGSLFWFVVVALHLWEWKANRNKKQHQILVAETVCAVMLLVSVSGFLFEAMKIYAIIVDMLITLAFFVFFVYICSQKHRVH
ncbi:MAG: hypothetical protein WAV98_01750 [Minisyncoccia bacterium]